MSLIKPKVLDNTDRDEQVRGKLEPNDASNGHPSPASYLFIGIGFMEAVQP